MESQILMEKVINEKADMDDVEEEIRKQLKSELHRCAFLHSMSYVKLRIAALYPTHTTAHYAYYGNLSVSLTPTSERPVVTLKCLDKIVYSSEKYNKRKCFKRRPSDEADGI